MSHRMIGFVGDNHHAPKNELREYMDEHDPVIANKNGTYLLLSNKAWVRMTSYIKMAEKEEVTGFLLLDKDEPLYAIDAFLVDQESGVGDVEPSDEGIADFTEAMLNEGHDPEQFLTVWWHSHPGNGTSPSGNDEAHFLSHWHNRSWAVMLIVGQDLTTTCRLMVRTPGRERQIILQHDIKVKYQELDVSRDDVVTYNVGEWREEFRKLRRPQKKATAQRWKSNGTSQVVYPGLDQDMELVWVTDDRVDPSVIPAEIVEKSSNGTKRVVCQQPVHNKTTCSMGYPIARKNRGRRNTRYAFGGYWGGDAEKGRPIEGGYVPVANDEWMRTQAILDAACGRYTRLAEVYDLVAMQTYSAFNPFMKIEQATRQRVGGNVSRFGSDDNGWQHAWDRNDVVIPEVAVGRTLTGLDERDRTECVDFLYSLPNALRQQALNILAHRLFYTGIGTWNKLIANVFFSDFMDRHKRHFQGAHVPARPQEKGKQHGKARAKV